MLYNQMDMDLENRLFSAIQLKNPSTLLDFGCGSGDLLFKILNKFPEIKLFGIDYFSKFANDFKTANLDNKITYIDKASDEFIKLTINQKFDFILSTFTLHHFQYPINEMLLIENLLNPQGLLWMCDFSYSQSSPEQKIKNILSYFDELRYNFQKGYHRHHYTLDEVSDLFMATTLNLNLLDNITYDMNDSDKQELKKETLERIKTTRNNLNYAQDFEKNFFSQISSLEETLLLDNSLERNTIFYLSAEKQ